MEIFFVIFSGIRIGGGVDRGKVLVLEKVRKTYL